MKYGHEALAPRRDLTGGLAEHCLLARGSAIFRVPDRLPDETACPANCATATVAGAVEAAGELADRSILILGCGMLGVTATAWANVSMAFCRNIDRTHVCDVSAGSNTDR